MVFSEDILPIQEQGKSLAVNEYLCQNIVSGIKLKFGEVAKGKHVIVLAMRCSLQNFEILQP